MVVPPSTTIVWPMIKVPAREASSSKTPAMSAAHREATAASPSARPIFVKHATELGIDDARADAREIIDINRDRVEDLLDNQRLNLSEGWANKLRKALQASDWLVCVYTGGQSEFCGLRDRPVRTPRKRDATAD